VTRIGGSRSWYVSSRFARAAVRGTSRSFPPFGGPK
jgi:hypothetical protein